MPAVAVQPSPLHPHLGGDGGHVRVVGHAQGAAAEGAACSARQPAAQRATSNSTGSQSNNELHQRSAAVPPLRTSRVPFCGRLPALPRPWPGGLGGAGAQSAPPHPRWTRGSPTCAPRGCRRGGYSNPGHVCRKVGRRAGGQAGGRAGGRAGRRAGGQAVEAGRREGLALTSRSMKSTGMVRVLMAPPGGAATSPAPAPVPVVVAPPGHPEASSKGGALWSWGFSLRLLVDRPRTHPGRRERRSPRAGTGRGRGRAWCRTEQRC